MCDIEQQKQQKQKKVNQIAQRLVSDLLVNQSLKEVSVINYHRKKSFIQTNNKKIKINDNM